MMQEGKEENGEKYLSVETEDEFHEALKRGHPVEVPPGAWGEDRLDVSRTWAPWRRSLTRRRTPMPSFRQRGEDYAKKVSSELIEQIKEGVAPWQKPWKPGEQCTPENFSTGKSPTRAATAFT